MIELILAIGVLYSLVTCIMLYYSTVHSSVKALALSFFVVTGLLVYDHYMKYIGTPVIGYPAGEFIYMHHVIQGDTIILWLQEGDTMKHRLHEFPYQRDAAKKLDQAQKNKQYGTEVSGQFMNRGRDEAPGLEIDRWEGPTGSFSKQP